MLPDSQGNLLMSWRPDGVLPDTLSRLSPGGGVVSTTAPGWNEYEVADSHGFVYGWWADWTVYGSRFLSAMDAATLTRVWTDSTVDRYLGATIVSTLAGGGVLVKDQEGRLVKFDQAGVKTVLTDPIEDASFEASNGGLMRGTSADQTMVLLDEALDGAWQTRGGNTSGQQRGTNPNFEVFDDYFAPIKSVKRSRIAGFRIVGIGDPQNWLFEPDDQTLPQITRTDGLDNSPLWKGWMVTSGIVSVRGTYRGQLKTFKKSLTVTARTDGWLSVPLESKEILAGDSENDDGRQMFALTGPGQLGLSWPTIRLRDREFGFVVGGPNSGLHYILSATDDSRHKHMIHPWLRDTGHEFHIKQWGGYDGTTNPTGWVYGPDLLGSVTDHEAGWGDDIVASHYKVYRRNFDSVAAKLKVGNPLFMFERLVGTDPQLTGRADVIIAALLAAQEDHDPEPCGGGIRGVLEAGGRYDCNGQDCEPYAFDPGQDCSNIGKVNFPPYRPVQPQP
jgi:hypothetical protein